MVGAPVAHDCKLGSNVILANNVALGGHVSIDDFAVLGGQEAVRQFVRIGEGAMAAGLSGVRADVIPFGSVQGSLADLIGPLRPTRARWHGSQNCSMRVSLRGVWVPECNGAQQERQRIRFADGTRGAT
jgi:UDP-3-O-[3-hydroxymyristoyl] glucosamine N-acyltransferase